MVHPAALPIEEFIRQVRVERGRDGGPGGQRRNKVETAVTATHLFTGVAAHAGEAREAERNRKTAIQRLRLRLALEHREPVSVMDYEPSALLRSRTRDGRIALNPSHTDAPAVLAEVLDVLAARNDDVSKAAVLLGVTTSQLLKILRNVAPEAMSELNKRRARRGLHGLK